MKGHAEREMKIAVFTRGLHRSSHDNPPEYHRRVLNLCTRQREQGKEEATRGSPLLLMIKTNVKEIADRFLMAKANPASFFEDFKSMRLETLAPTAIKDERERNLQNG